MEEMEASKSTGQQMTEAQAAVYAGRQVMTELMQQEPIDWRAVDECRANINAARGVVKIVARKLDREKTGAPLGENTSWMKW